MRRGWGGGGGGPAGECGIPLTTFSLLAFKLEEPTSALSSRNRPSITAPEECFLPTCAISLEGANSPGSWSIWSGDKKVFSPSFMGRDDDFNSGWICRRVARQEYWSGLPCPLPGNLPDPGIEPASLTSPAWWWGIVVVSSPFSGQASGQASRPTGAATGPLLRDPGVLTNTEKVC